MAMNRREKPKHLKIRLCLTEEQQETIGKELDMVEKGVKRPPMTEKEQEAFFEKKERRIKSLQRRMLNFDRLLLESEELPTDTGRTIAEEEQIIINKYGGKKLSTEYFYSHLSDFFKDNQVIDCLKKMSPCRIIYDETEEIIPEEYFFSFYIIPFGEEKKIEWSDYKELIAFITSRDGTYVYDAGTLTETIVSPDEQLKKIIQEVGFCPKDHVLYESELAWEESVRGIVVEKDDKDDSMVIRGELISD